jgi:hypothetical protein
MTMDSGTKILGIPSLVNVPPGRNRIGGKLNYRNMEDDNMNDAEYNEQYNIDVDMPEVEGYRDDDVSSLKHLLKLLQ